MNESKIELRAILSSLGGLLGSDNDLIVRTNREDFAHFKSETEGHYVIMGRKTVESLPKKLPNRKVVCITSDEKYENDKCDYVCNGVIQCMILLEELECKIAYVAGGELIYDQFSPFVDQIIITQFDTKHYDYNVDDSKEIKFVPYSMTDAMLNMRVVQTKDIEHGQIIYYQRW